jgi:outer membrane protein assembly factor BamB
VTGGVLWTYSTADDDDQNSFHGSTLLTEDTVLFGTDSPAGRFYALDRESAGVHWDHPAGLGVFSDPLRLNDHVVLMTLEDELICLDLDDGSVHWRAASTSTDEGAENRTNPVLTGSRVIVGRPDGTLDCHEISTGRRVWRRNLEEEITATGPDGSGGVLVATAANELFRITPELGLVTGRRFTDGSVARSPLVTETGIILFYEWMAEGGEVVSLTPDLETVNWRYPAPEGASFTVSRAHPWRDVLLVGTDEGDIIALDPMTGAERWTHRIEGSVRTMAHDAETLYVGTIQGTLYALAAE